MVPLFKTLMQKKTGYSDAELAEQIKASNHDAFEKLFFKYYHDLYRFLIIQTKSVEQSKDIAQETFARLWQNRSALKPNLSIKAYFYKIANNLVMDYFRRQNTISNSLSNLSNLFQIKTENYELRLHIQEAIENLPEDLKLTFVLHRFEGLKYREIAGVCDVSEKTVEFRMSKALKILQKNSS